MNLRRRLVAGAAAIMIAPLIVVIMPTSPAQAHGWIEGAAPSRQHQCWTQVVPDCGDIKYEPQSVEAPKGSMQCNGGGSRFAVLNNNNHGWQVTRIGSSVTLRWRLTAAHRTSTWEYFVDGRLHRTFNEGNQQPNPATTHTITGLPSGRHLILARWNIGDTVMAFYNCMDVQVGGGTGPPPPPPPGPQPPPPPPPPPGGTWAPNVDYQVGARVTYGGRGYQCRQAHRSLPGWEPPNTPALWLAL